MTLNEYMINMRAFIKANPKAKQMQVGYCVDDEGNGYDSVKFSPSIISTDDVESYMFKPDLSGKVVIIN